MVESRDRIPLKTIFSNEKRLRRNFKCKDEKDGNDLEWKMTKAFIELGKNDQDVGGGAEEKEEEEEEEKDEDL